MTRRVARGWTFAFGAATSLAAAAVLSGCTPATNYDGVEIVAGSAVLEPEREQIVFPSEKYDASQSERRIIMYALLLLEADCTADAGFPHDVPDVRGPTDVEPDASMGLWSMDRAAKWGYGEIPPSAEKQALISATGKTVREQEAWSACIQTVREDKILDEGFFYDPNLLTTRARYEALDAARATSEWKEVAGAWKECVEDAGLQVDPDNDVGILGVPEFTPEESIRAAVADVKCKESLDLTQRLADIRASYELRFISQHEAALTEERAKIDALLSKANEIIAAHGG